MHTNLLTCNAQCTAFQARRCCGCSCNTAEDSAASHRAFLDDGPSAYCTFLSDGQSAHRATWRTSYHRTVSDNKDRHLRLSPRVSDVQESSNQSSQEPADLCPRWPRMTVPSTRIISEEVTASTPPTQKKESR